MTNELIANIARATNRNDHWLAATYIVNEYGSECEKQIISLYAYRAYQRGYGNEAEMAVRDNIVKTLIQDVARDLGADAANSILEAL